MMKAISPSDLVHWWHQAADMVPAPVHAEPLAYRLAYRHWLRDSGKAMLGRGRVPPAARRALRVAGDVVRETGSVTLASRQFAFLLSDADAETRDVALRIAASRGAKSNALVDVATVRRTWANLAALRPLQHRWVKRTGKDPLPVERARTVPVSRVLEELGLELHQRGHSFTARCPFHEDDHPSLTINPDDTLWFCFPCAIGGDGIRFVEKHRGCSFAEAVREVVQWAA